MNEKPRDQKQYEMMKSRHIGVGNPDSTRQEWFTNIKRDTYASMVSHPALLEYYSLAVDEPVQISRTKLIEKMAESYEEPK